MSNADSLAEDLLDSVCAVRDEIESGNHHGAHDMLTEARGVLDRLLIELASYDPP